MICNRVVDVGADIGRVQMSTQRLASGGTHNGKMCDTIFTRWRRHANLRMANALDIGAEDPPPRGVFLLEIRQAHLKHRRLQFVETAVAPTVDVDAILFFPTVLPQRAHAMRQPGVVRRHGTGVPQSAEVLGRIEAEATNIAQAARACAPAARTMGPGAGFDDADAAGPCYAA